MITAPPWKYELAPEYGNAEVRGKGGNLVCEVWSGFRPTAAQVEANARLIASAPDLLRIVLSIYGDWPEFETNENVNGADLVEYMGAIRKRLKAVITKASGT